MLLLGRQVLLFLTSRLSKYAMEVIATTHRETQAEGAARDASAQPFPSGAAAALRGETLADIDGELDESSPEIRRNWSPEVLLALANIYKRVVLENPETSRLGVLQLVYEEFRRGPHCANRSRKAVDDKLYTMKQMYHFIMKMNGNFKPGYRKSVPTWFELTKQERRAVRYGCAWLPSTSDDVSLLVGGLTCSPALVGRCTACAHPTSRSRSSACSTVC